ncbi:hypothetical protein LFLT20_08950 [Limosilactobacillus fermentum]|nr:hypothetical protein LFLT20_08950 [Limosilactobacillus fermentum]
MPIHSRRVIKQDVWIERPDHSKLRLAIFRAKQVATKRPATGILWLHGGATPWKPPKMPWFMLNSWWLTDGP